MKKISSYYGDTETVPAPTDDLIVRPDILRASFQIQIQGAFASQEALSRLQQETEQLRRKLREATDSVITLKMTGVLLSAAPAKRLRIP